MCSRVIRPLKIKILPFYQQSLNMLLDSHLQLANAGIHYEFILYNLKTEETLVGT